MPDLNTRDPRSAALTLPHGIEDKPPKTSIDVAAFDAGRTYNTAMERREELGKVPTFPIQALDGIPAMVAELRTAERAVEEARDENLEASLRPAREEADRLIRTVTTGARYLCRNDPEAMAKLEAIGETGAMPDRVGDLLRVAELIKGREALLAADQDIPADAAERARQLAEKLTTVPDATPFKAALRRRNLAFWMLDRSVDEVRQAVRFRFRNDPKFVERACGGWEPREKSKDDEAPATPE